MSIMVEFNGGIVGEAFKETESGNCFVVRIYKYPEGMDRYENDMTIVRKEEAKIIENLAS